MKQLIQRCGVFLMILLLISGVLSSCGTEEGNKEEFTEPEPPSSSGTDEITSIAPAPGHIVIGKIRDGVYSDSIDVSKSMLSEYCLFSGSTIEIKEFKSDKEMITAARSGEIDILFGNNLISYILAHENRLLDLTPYLTPVVASENYYQNIIEAGIVNGGLVLLCPSFSIGSCIGVPQGAIDVFNGAPKNQDELIEFYDILEPEYRTGGVQLYLSRNIIDTAIDFDNHNFDISPYWNSWKELLHKQDNDSINNHLYQEENVYSGLFENMEGSYFADPTLLFDRYVLMNGKTYTQYGSQCTLIPYPFNDSEGFTILGETYSIPTNSPNIEASLDLCIWMMSFEGQKQILSENRGCPVLRSESQKWFFRFRSHPQNQYSTEEQQAIAEQYIKQADRFPICSNALWQSCEMLLTQTGDKNSKIEWKEMLTSTEIIPELGGVENSKNNAARAEGYKILFDFFDKFEHEESIPKFYQEGALDIWPELVNDYVRAYITDLGYDMNG